jgi:hypothetical protein
MHIPNGKQARAEVCVPDGRTAFILAAIPTLEYIFQPDHFKFDATAKSCHLRIVFSPSLTSSRNLTMAGLTNSRLFALAAYHCVPLVSFYPTTMELPSFIGIKSLLTQPFRYSQLLCEECCFYPLPPASANSSGYGLIRNLDPFRISSSSMRLPKELLARFGCSSSPS